MAQTKVIHFMAQRRIATTVSALLLIGSIVSLAINGLQFGLDFTGGTQLEIGFEKPLDLGVIRKTLDKEGLKNPSVVYFGSESDVLIRMQGSLSDVALQQIETNLSQQYGKPIVVTEQRITGGSDEYGAQLQIDGVANLDGKVEAIFPVAKFGAVKVEPAGDGATTVLVGERLGEVISSSLLAELQRVTNQRPTLRRSEFVGPQIGEELSNDGGLGMLFALVVVMVYVALRFQLKFSFGAVAALVHDVIIVLGFFSIWKLDFDLTVLAAVLAVIGYSLNDTIVVSDRIRENFRKLRKGAAVDIVNVSLTQTLGRTLVTSFTTLLVLVALFVFGGELINGFATALIVGVIVGTYSSIYVAANVLVTLGISKEDLIVPVREGAELDEMP